jgi:predicted nucleic acid-binding protein
LIDAERRLLDVDQMLEGLGRYDADECAVSSISLMELAHGLVRARTDAKRAIRAQFLDDLRAGISTIAVSDEIAIRAGELDGLLRQVGVTIGAADVLIAATALLNDYAVATFNVRHFKAVPGLAVVEL